MTLIIKENEALIIEEIGAQQVSLQANASLVHVFTSESENKKLVIDLGLGATYKAVILQKNNNLDLTINLNEPQAKTDIASVFFADDKQNCSITVNHNASFTTSNQLVKGIAFEKGLADISLKTFVNLDIKSIEAYQLFKGIVLDDSSEIKSKPLLDIYSDDVICSHGSSIGTIDEKQLFYMQTRGIDKSHASKILISAFISEVIDKANENEKILENLSKYLGDIK